jgi:hypothetical protein
MSGRLGASSLGAAAAPTGPDRATVGDGGDR